MPRGAMKGALMGLDMYAFTIPADLASRAVDMKLDDLPGREELHYWRKHPNLHGWMEHLYFNKGGAELFNCATVRLTYADLVALEAAIRNNDLPHTTGFFFGETDGSEKKDDLAFVEKAMQAIAEGKAVYYDSWW
jgi:hypothetical protein